MEQTIGSFLIKVASEFGLSISILVGMILYFIKKESRFEDKDKEITSTIDRLIATIDELKMVIQVNTKGIDEVKEQNSNNRKSIDELNNSFELLNQNLELTKKIDTKEQELYLKNIELKLDEIKDSIIGLKR